MGKVKKLIGVEPGTKLQPMIAYNSAIFFSGGGPYVMGCYLLPFLTKVEGLTTAQYGTVALFSCICDAITDPLMGIITDRTKHKDGRHIECLPYLYLALIKPFSLCAGNGSKQTKSWSYRLLLPLPYGYWASSFCWFYGESEKLLRQM
jgi:hypothetical protein